MISRVVKTIKRPQTQCGWGLLKLVSRWYNLDVVDTIVSTIVSTKKIKWKKNLFTRLRRLISITIRSLFPRIS